jgi:alpha-beta hydrolase superfamily lysophospholipase
MDDEPTFDHHRIRRVADGIIPNHGKDALSEACRRAQNLKAAVINLLPRPGKAFADSSCFGLAVNPVSAVTAVVTPMPSERRGTLPAGLRGLCACALLLLAAACTPQFVPAGPAIDEPRLATGHWVTADGLELPLRSWLPEEPPHAVILALHGFNDYSAAFKDPGVWWAERGIATYAYDQRGFGAAAHRGRWAGSESLSDDLVRLTGLIRARHPGRPLYLLGESMGGAVIMVAFAENPTFSVDGAILSAPAVRARSTMSGYQRLALEVVAYLMPWGRLTREPANIQASDNIEMLRALVRDPLVIKRTRFDAIYGLTNLMDQALASSGRITAPLLLLYGERDEVIPQDPTFEAWNGLPAKANGRQRLALYEDGWHLLLRGLGAETVLDDVAAWITDPKAPLPSGADRRARAVLGEVAKIGAAD